MRLQVVTLLAAFALGLIVGGCGSVVTTGAPSPTPGPSFSVAVGPTPLAILGTVWRAIAISGMPTVPGAEPSIAFDEVGLRGTTGCNEWRGRATIGEAGAFRVAEVTQTRRACPGQIGLQEARFLQALLNVTTIALRGEQLFFVGDGGEIAFVPA